MRQVQITTEAGISILLVIFVFVLVVITVQQSKLNKSIKIINTSVKNTQEIINETN